MSVGGSIIPDCASIDILALAEAPSGEIARLVRDLEPEEENLATWASALRERSKTPKRDAYRAFTALLDLGRPDLARGLAQALLSRADADPPQLFDVRFAERLEKERFFKDAVPWRRADAARRPDELNAEIALARALHAAGSTLEAVKRLEELVAGAGSNDPDVWRGLLTILDSVDDGLALLRHVDAAKAETGVWPEIRELGDALDARWRGILAVPVEGRSSTYLDLRHAERSDSADVAAHRPPGFADLPEPLQRAVLQELHRRAPDDVDLGVALTSMICVYGREGDGFEVARRQWSSAPQTVSAAINLSRFADLIDRPDVADAAEQELVTHVKPGPVRSMFTRRFEIKRSARPVNLRPGRSRCAVCVSGQLRGYERAWPSIVRHVVEPLGADVFVSVWDNVGGEASKHGLVDRALPAALADALPESDLEFGSFQNLAPKLGALVSEPRRVSAAQLKTDLGATSVTVADEAAFDAERDALGREDASTLTGRVLRNAAKMFYQVHEADALRRTAEAEADEPYDVVVRVRPDKRITRSDWRSILPMIVDESVVVGHALFKSGFGFGDQFAVGSGPAIEALSGVWEAMRNGDMERRSLQPWDRAPERALFDHAFAAGLRMRVLERRILGRMMNGRRASLTLAALLGDLIEGPLLSAIGAEAAGRGGLELVKEASANREFDAEQARELTSRLSAHDWRGALDAMTSVVVDRSV